MVGNGNAVILSPILTPFYHTMAKQTASVVGRGCVHHLLMMQAALG